MPLWYILLLLFVALQRLAEMYVSKKNQAWLFSQGAQKAPERLFPLMVLVHVGLFLGTFLEVSFLHRPFLPIPGTIAFLIFLMAQLLRVWALTSLRRSWNVQIVVSENLPVVDKGPYRYMRHPNYLAVILEIVALPMIHHAYLSAIFFSLLNAIVLKERIHLEEKELFTLPEYREKMESKPRLFPRIFSR